MGNLVIMAKGGRELTVDEHARHWYLENGYNVIDAKTGKVLERAKGGIEVTTAMYNEALDKIDELESLTGDGASDKIAELELKLADARDEVAELKKTNATLKGEITKLKGANK